MKKLLLLGTFVGTLAITAPAHAHGFFSLRIGIPPVSVHVGVPAPVPVYAPVVCAPRRIVIGPPAVIIRPRVFVPPPVVIYRPHHRHLVAPPYYR